MPSNASGFGVMEMVGGLMAVPLIGRLNGVPPVELAVIMVLMSPRVAVAAGEKVTVRVQVPVVAARVWPVQVSLPMTNWASEVATVTPGAATPPVFLTVKATAVPEVPTATEPKSATPVMLRLLGKLAMPLIDALRGAAGAEASVTTSVAVFVPAVVGLNVTVIAQVLSGATPGVQVEALTTNSGLAGVIAPVTAPEFTPPELATVNTTSAVAPVVAEVVEVRGESTSLAAVTTVAVMAVVLVTLPALQTTWSPVLTPAVADEKLKPTTQLAPAARVAPQVPTTVASATMFPPVETEQMRSVNAVVAVTLTRPGTTAPAETVPRSTLSVTEKLAGGAPVPLRLTLTAPETVRVPLARPTAVGANDTEMVHVAGAAARASQLVATMVKGPVVTDGVSDTGAVPLLVTVTIEGVELVLPTSTVPRFSVGELTLTLTGGGE